MATIESIRSTKDLIRRGVITAPARFLAMSSTALSSIVNGCGAANAKFDYVPDTIWGLCVTPCCHVHDLEYFKGETQKEKRDADFRMYINLLFLINHTTGWDKPVLKTVRLIRATWYYAAVGILGDSAFWEGKR